MIKHYDAVIIGAGSMGMAAGYYLSKHGVKTLLLDQFNPPHDKGSHHGETRIIRHAYGEGSEYVPLVLRAQRLWEELQDESGMNLFLRTGVLCAGASGSAFVQQAMDSARKYSLPIDSLSCNEINERWPGFELPEGFSGCFEPDSGILFSEQCIAAFRKLGQENGMTLLPYTKVEKLEMSSNGAVVSAAGAVFHADYAVVSAGAWSGKILKEVGLELPLQPVRKSVSWMGCPAELYDSRVFPVYTVDLGDSFYYGFPSINGSGMKVGRHDHGLPIDPDGVINPYGPDDEQDIRSFLRQCMPKANGPLVKGSTCFYTMTPDEDFILDRHPEYSNLFVAAGFSGHGFKFSSVVGEIISQVIVKGKSEFDLSKFSIIR